jgi:hypothetical protein
LPGTDGSSLSVLRAALLLGCAELWSLTPGAMNPRRRFLAAAAGGVALGLLSNPVVRLFVWITDSLSSPANGANFGPVWIVPLWCLIAVAVSVYLLSRSGPPSLRDAALCALSILAVVTVVDIVAPFSVLFGDVFADILLAPVLVAWAVVVALWQSRRHSPG